MLFAKNSFYKLAFSMGAVLNGVSKERDFKIIK